MPQGCQRQPRERWLGQNPATYQPDELVWAGGAYEQAHDAGGSAIEANKPQAENGLPGCLSCRSCDQRRDEQAVPKGSEPYPTSTARRERSSVMREDILCDLLCTRRSDSEEFPRASYSGTTCHGYPNQWRNLTNECTLNSSPQSLSEEETCEL